MYYENKFEFKDNLDNPTHLDDDVHKKIELPQLNKEIIRNIFVVNLIF